MLDHMLSSQQLAVICALSSGVNMTTAAEQAGVHRNTVTNWRRNLLPFQRALADAQYDRALLYREKMEDLVDPAVQSLRDILTDPKASPTVKLRAALTVVNIATTPPLPKKQIELNIETIVVENHPYSEPQSLPNDAQPATPSDVAKATNPQPSTAPESAQPELNIETIVVENHLYTEPQSLPNDAQPATPSDVAKATNPQPSTAPESAQPELNIPTQVVENHPDSEPPSVPNTAQPDLEPEPESTPNDAQFATPSSAPAAHETAQPRGPRQIARNAQCPCQSGKKYKRCCLNTAAHRPLADAA